jgi:hypothetical protein
MAFDGEPSDFKSTAEKDASAVFGGESLFENLKAANDNNEREFSLDSAEAIQSLLEYVEDTALDNWIDIHPADWSGFSDTESYQLLTELQHEAKILEDKIETGEVSDVDAIVLQVLIDKFQEHESPDVVENSIEEEPFDINTYITEQFAEHPYLSPSALAPVYNSYGEYKRTLDAGLTEVAEMLAQRIKDHVDELAGNDTIAQEGVGANLEFQERRREERRRGELTVEDLDPEESDLGRRIFDGVDRTSPSENNTKIEAITTELYGMQLPTADDRYRFNAITFRDGLELAMRHDTELSQLPDKQQLFAELLQLLEFVPTEGITAETSEQLRELAQKINDPNEAIQRTGVAKEVPIEVSHAAEVSTKAKLSPEEQLRVLTVGAGVESLEPELAEEAMNGLVDELPPEEQLKKDSVEYGVKDLEPPLAEEAYVEPVESDETEVRAALTSSAPAAVQEDQPSREAAREVREYKKKFEDKIKGIEHLDSGGFFSRLVNAGQSPYKVLADMNFEDIVLSSQPPYADSFNRSNYMKGLNVDQSAFENWMKLLPEIDDFSIETNGRTFKEVTDDLIVAQLKEGNTQST